MTFDIRYAGEIFPQLLRASLVNVEATVAGFGLAVIGGLFLALARMSRVSWLALSATGVIEFIRDTPFLIQVYALFYILPVSGIRLDPLPTGILALGLNYSAYTAEVYRAGIESVQRGQWEAAIALNLPIREIWWRVILPQAVPPVVPVLGNYLIAMFKDSAILATISVNELLGTALVLGNETFRFLEPITVVAFLFLAMSLAGSVPVRLLEWRRRRR